MDPEAMLEFLGHLRFPLAKSGHKLSARRFRLYAVAVCRRVWSLLTDETLRTAVETAEKYADGNATEEELAAVYSDAETVVSKVLATALSPLLSATNPQPTSREAGIPANAASAAWATLRVTAFDAARHAAQFACLAASGSGVGERTRSHSERLAQAHLLRDIFGTPWRRPSTVDLASNYSIAKMAGDICDARSFERLPGLAAALEEAGCADAELLAHLRSEGPHVRGCWALDAVLGLE